MIDIINKAQIDEKDPNLDLYQEVLLFRQQQAFLQQKKNNPSVFEST